MNKWGKQPELHFDKKELKTNLGAGNFIFVGSSCDMWANGIPSTWISEIIDYCRKFDNKYLFQTKNPARILLRDDHKLMIENSVICTTIETNRFYPDIMCNSPSMNERASAMYEISKTVDTYVTIEPIMDFDLDQLIDLVKECNPKQVNIGADTGKNNLSEPTPEKVIELINTLKTFTVVKEKSNLKRLLKRSITS
jgi:DNA repair photolyase